MAAPPPKPRRKRRGPGRVGVEGTRELKAKVKDLLQGLSGEQRTQFAKEINQVIGSSAALIADEAKRNAQAQGLDHNIQRAIFTYNKFVQGMRKRTRNTALVGVARGEGTAAYIDWVTTTGPGVTTSKDGKRTIVRKVPIGGYMGMSEATMAEMGTSRRLPTPFFRPAVLKWRKFLRKHIAHGIRGAMEKYYP